MTKKSETGPVLAHFDEHGMFELDAELAGQVGGGLPPMPPIVTNLRKRVHDTLNDPDGNRVCVSRNVICGGDGFCRDLVCNGNIACP